MSALPSLSQEAKVSLATKLPYYSQWESFDLAQAIIEGMATPADDPCWASSGALDQKEYIQWANHICGMACLKMILAAIKGEEIPTMDLTRMAVRYGAYVLSKDGIKGMIYAPFVTLIREQFALESRIEAGKTSQDIAKLLKEGAYFIASVHPSIRWPERKPPSKGGHLVLVTAADQENICFHNPSGHTQETRENVTLSCQDFDRFFAGRGVLILGQEA
ncbi:MAG: hypothetical protein EOM37_05590 [Proteobacteria bacterium]|nr:C39 family peptidase [Alphaproteobacteria bacterium]NCC03506.1 hypothetical protein [Pseudomonadota bacterium]